MCCRGWRANTSGRTIEGIIHERWAKAQLVARSADRHGRSAGIGLRWVTIEQAQQLCAPKDPDAILRWNACVRVLDRHARTSTLVETLTDDVEAGFSDDVPAR